MRLATDTRLLSATAITRECLRVLHQKLNFVGTITREYDDSFARQGAKVGDTLKVRLPSHYDVRTGFGVTQGGGEAVAEVRATVQRGVELNFTAADLTLTLDEFSDRIIAPQMTELARILDGDAAQMYRAVYNQVNAHGQPLSFAKVLQARKILVDNLAPLNGRTCNLSRAGAVDLEDALRGLFNDRLFPTTPRRADFMGRTAGFDFMGNGPWPLAAVGGGDFTVAGAAQTGDRLAVRGEGAPAEGDVFTIPGVMRVHPETRQSTGILQQFVVVGFDGGAIQISPAIVTSGAAQNVTGSPATGAAITFAGTASQAHGISMAYQKGAFAFATADMVMPRGVDFASREVFDGISGRLIRQYDINSDKFPCRFDVLFGRAPIRPSLACRMAHGEAA